MALNPKYMIAPSVQETFVDPSTGVPLAGGTVTFYSDVNRATLKPIYELSGTVPSYTYTQLQNPVQLSGGGTFFDGTSDILPYYYPYDSSGNLELYYIVVKDSAGNTKLTRQAYPNVTNQSSANNFGYDFVRNQTFAKWSTSTNFVNIGVGGVVADDWTYTNDDATQTIGISRQSFGLGPSPLPGNPLYYLQYANTGVGSQAQTTNQLIQSYASVQTLNGEDVTISLFVKQTVALSSLHVILNQYFGSGGSASVPTPVITVAVTRLGDWTQFIGTATLPSVATGTVGPNGDDALQLIIQFPINTVTTVGIANVQMQSGDSVSAIIEKSIDDISRGTNYQTPDSLFETGDVKMTIRNVASRGWLMMNDQTIGNPASNAGFASTSSKALFTALWNNIHSLIYTPMYTSTGAPVVSFGASAEADWDANNQLSLTKVLGRVLAGAAPSGYSVSKVISVTPTTQNIVINDSSSFYFGTPVTFTTSGTLPSPLAINTTYYVTPVNSTTIFVSTTLANAISGTYIQLTTPGTGTNNVVITYPAHQFGFFAGEENHLLVTNEIPSHTHSYTGYTTIGGASGSGVTAISTATSPNTGATGGGATHNNIQPVTYLNVMIKL